MRVLITSPPDELRSHAETAAGFVASLGWRALDHDRLGARSLDEGLRAVDAAQLVIALVGWRRGPLPGAVEGWDGETPWAAYEIRRAFALQRPVLVLMADDSWPRREHDPRARALMADLRAELEPLAVALGPELGGADSGAGLRRVLDVELSRFRPKDRPSFRPSSPTSRSLHPGLGLRSSPAPSYPPEPWPLLLPYEHPDLLAGRELELGELVARLDRPQPILGLHAVSGVGKSSMLAGALVPGLRAAGRPVALETHPAEAGLAERLVADLLSGPELPLGLDAELEQGGHETFIEHLLLAYRLSGSPPVLVLDQVEQLLRGNRRARAVLGTLLAATVCRRPEIEGPPCRWLLAYRREFHGELVRWLGDALREARALGFGNAASGSASDDGVARPREALRLPHDLAGHERFHAWPLAPLGAPRSGEDPFEAAHTAFRAAISKPLALLDENGHQRYARRFAGDGAERLAATFAAARARDPEAPLVPELQAVLAHLLASAGSPHQTVDRPLCLVVPEDPGALVDSALEKHLARGLDVAFPTPVGGPQARIARTRALLALRQLADAHGRRAAGRSGDSLIRVIGEQGHEVLEKLQAPGVRLVVASTASDGGTIYQLSHDRLAEVIVAAADGEGRLAVDSELLSLARLVALRSALFHGGERQASTLVVGARLDAIEQHAECLLVDRDQQEWWAACCERRRRGRRRRLATALAAAALIAVTAWLIASGVADRAAREARLDLLAQGSPDAAFAAFGETLEDPQIEAVSIFASLGERAAPFDIFELGLGGAEEPRRSPLVLAAAELAIPWLHRERPDDRVALASLIWALDYGPGRVPTLAGRARELRDAALAPLRQRSSPPPPGEDWVNVPAGTFLMGSDDGEVVERPTHAVTLSAFRILDHEVTHAELRRLYPEHQGAGDLPASLVTWYDAVVYAAWLGGRLPSEAEWEYAARAGCAYDYCRADGSEAAVEEVAWMLRNSAGGGEPWPHPGRELAANPWGLYDQYGNLWEWTADWWAPYPAGPQVDPRGPPAGSRRASRGGSFNQTRAGARAGMRGGFDPASASDVRGFRPVLPPEPKPR